MILIISSLEDDHAVTVLQHLSRRNIHAHLLDLSDFPSNMNIAIQYSLDTIRSTLQNGAGEVDLSACQVVWWRRPQPFILHDEIQDPSYRSFAYTECQAAISGLWHTLDAFWINHPTRDEEASRKAYQLQVASQVGLTTPRTLISNSPQQVRAFVDNLGHDHVIYKSFYATVQAWRETRLLKREEVALLDATRFAPVIFQEYIPAELDLRITIMGNHIFPVAIYSQETGYRVDYRMEMDKARIQPHQLPVSVTRLLVKFMKKLGLVYGAVDMRLTPKGEYVFLEVNPSGQWLFVEERSGLPMTEAFTELLIRHAQ